MQGCTYFEKFNSIHTNPFLFYFSHSRPPKKLREGNVFSLVCLSGCPKESCYGTITHGAIGQSHVTWGLLDMLKLVFFHKMN